MNRLSREKAAYLRHAAHQRIDWYPWCDEAFNRARLEDKPVFLSTGAVWCHWCHVMAAECFEDEEVIRLLNENCINVKLDRDERPEIDRVYQQAVAAMGSGGGWPLSVFMTPDRKPFFGGTYFPVEDSLGRPGFRKVIRSVVDFYRSRRDEVLEYSDKLINFLQPERKPGGVVIKSAVADAVGAVLEEFDPQNGGFGKSPKFPMPGAIELLINHCHPAFVKNDTSLEKKASWDSTSLAVRKTLKAMAKGGFHDQLGGGFHRYSVDEAWLIPHFEKMADDNAWLLRNYADAYCLFGDPYFKEVSYDIIRFIKDVLSDPGGGFYASQDADVTPDDEGGYFTWTDSDFRSALTEEEYRVLSLHLFHERGSMQHDSSRKVLFVAMEAHEIDRGLGLAAGSADEIIRRGKEKLLTERSRRQSPLVDTTQYTSLNGMLISSYLRAYRAFREPYMKQFALKTLDSVMKLRFVDGMLFHAEGVKALLDDYICMIDSFVSAYELTGKRTYLDCADKLMTDCVKVFKDDGGGLFDSPDQIVGVRLKSIEDIPHPSANSLAIICLLKLSFLTGKDSYYHHAEDSLKAFSLRAKDMGIHSAYYYCAMDEYFNMLKVALEVAPHSELAYAARFTFNPYVVLAYGNDRGFATPCRTGSCYESIHSADVLADFLKRHPRAS